MIQAEHALLYSSSLSNCIWNMTCNVIFLTFKVSQRQLVRPCKRLTCLYNWNSSNVSCLASSSGCNARGCHEYFSGGSATWRSTLGGALSNTCETTPPSVHSTSLLWPLWKRNKYCSSYFKYRWALRLPWLLIFILNILNTNLSFENLD